LTISCGKCKLIAAQNDRIWSLFPHQQECKFVCLWWMLSVCLRSNINGGDRLLFVDPSIGFAHENVLMGLHWRTSERRLMGVCYFPQQDVGKGVEETEIVHLQVDV
jgi:hypothetical protein